MEIRERVIAAFRELAGHRGLHAVTVDELAYRAGISKRTLYRYFRSKEEIVEAALDAFMDDVGREVDRLTSSGEKAGEIIDSLLRTLILRGQFLFHSGGVYDLKRYYPHLWEKILRFRTGKIQGIIGVLIRKSEREEVRRIDSAIVTEAFLAAVNAVANPDFILSHGLTFEETAGQLVRLIRCAFVRD